jgi:hypothetical protein
MNESIKHQETTVTPMIESNQSRTSYLALLTERCSTQRALQKSTAPLLVDLQREYERIKVCVLTQSQTIQKGRDSETAVLGLLRDVVLRIQKLDRNHSQSKLESLSNILCGLETRAESLMSSISSSEKELKESKLAISQLSTRREILCHEFDQLNILNHDHSCAIETLEKDKNAIFASNREWADKVGLVDASITQAREDLEKLEARLRELPARETELKQIMETSRLRFRDAENTLSEKLARLNWVQRVSQVHRPPVLISTDGSSHALVDELDVNSHLLRIQSLQQPVPEMIKFVSSVVAFLCEINCCSGACHREMVLLLENVDILRKENQMLVGKCDSWLRFKTTLLHNVVLNSLRGSVLNASLLSIDGSQLDMLLEYILEQESWANQLHEFDFNNNSLDDSALPSIHRVINSLPNISHLKLNRNMFHQGGINSIVSYLKRLEGITSVTESDTLLRAYSGSFLRLRVDLSNQRVQD